MLGIISKNTILKAIHNYNAKAFPGELKCWAFNFLKNYVVIY